MTEEPQHKFDYAAFMKSIEDENGPHQPVSFHLRLGASIADSLQRIANAQEMIAQLTNIDLDETIQQGSKILYAEMKAKENAGNAN